MASHPTQPDEITLDWFNSVIAAEVGSRASSISVEPLGDGEGFYGTLSKIHAKYQADQHRSASYVAKFSARDAHTRAALNRMHIYEREVDFYARLSGRMPLKVPRCYFSSFDPDTGQSTLLLEFLEGDCRDEMVGPTHDQAKLALRAAARLHRFGQDEGVTCEGWVHRLDGPEFMDGMILGARDAAPLAAERLQGLAPDWLLDAAPRAPEIISNQLRAMAALPDTLIHFDFRVGNMIFQPVEHPTEVALIDWQALLRGPGICDVAMLAFVSLPTEKRRAWENDLVLGYLTDVAEYAPTVWPSWVEEAWCRMAVFLAVNMVRNTPVFDLSNPAIREFVSELCSRIDAAIQDHEALRYLTEPS